MKIRQGFVSNSSSTSFIASLSDLTAEQVFKLQKWCSESDWTYEIDLDGNQIRGRTSMDNADIYDFLEREHINRNPVKVVSNG
jgi:hypothetical protein